MLVTEQSSFIFDWNTSVSITNEFLSTNRQSKYVFGCNELAKNIGQLIPISGFIDDQTENKLFDGKPVLRSSEISSDSIVVSAIVGVLPVSVERKIHSLGVAHVDYFAFAKISGLDLIPIPFWGSALEEMTANIDLYRQIQNRMGDEISKQTMDDLINFRNEMNLEYMISYSNQQNDQYFEDFLELERANLNFYDLGCFDGYTSSEFARLSPEYSSINAFEPIPRQHQECVKNLELLDSCVVHNFGAAERNHSLMFSDNGSASTAIDGIGTLVSLKRLDDLDLPLPDLIKIDIEGSEVDAMRGMRNLIQLGQPTMAVACYHYPSEMRDIVGFWDSLSLNGPLQLRHYTEGISETVIFITPEFSE